MKITDIKTLAVSYPLEEPLRWGNLYCHAVGSVIIQVSTDEGITGYGEAGPHPTFYERIRNIIETILKPLLLNRDPFDIEQLWETMYGATHGHGRRGVDTYALSGVDIALWDLVGKACEKPVYKILGGHSGRIQAYAAPSLKEPHVIARECEEFVEQGFKAIKLRVGVGVEKDIEIVEAARAAVGDEIQLMVDPNMAYSFRTAVEMGKVFEDYDVFWMEEPILTHGLEQYVGELKRLSEHVNIRVAGGESLMTRFEFRDLLAQRAVDIVQPDCALGGGITDCRKVAHIATLWSVPCVPHVSCSTVPAFALAANLHLIGSIPNHLFLEYPAYSTPLREEFLVEPILAKGGYVDIPDKPGLGLEINEKALAKYAHQASQVMTWELGSGE